MSNANVMRDPTRLRPLERDRELSRIQHALAEVSGGTGTLLVLEGPAGIGKSRLLDEARAMAADGGILALRARGDELERTHPFGLVSSLLESRFARATEAERRELLRGHAAMAAPLLTPATGEAELAATTDEFALLHGLYWAVVNLSEHSPLALMVDDVHWADELSLRFLVYLAARLEDLPVALMVAIRTGDPVESAELIARLSAASPDHALRPAELSEHAVGELLAAATLEVADPDGFARASWRATRGNPFLIHELVAALRQEATGGITINADSVTAFAPQSVARTVVVRLARLGEAAVELARACALLGNEALLPVASEVARLDLDAAFAAAERLLAAEIFESIEPLSFAHQMIRSAIAAELPTGWSGRAHLRAARTLHERGADAADVARHLLEGTPCSEPWAQAALHEAGRTAARKGAPATAVRHLRRALELNPASAHNAPLLIDLGMVEAAAGERTSVERFERALATLRDAPAEQARALYALGQTLYRYGRPADAAEIFTRGAALFEADDREQALTFEGARMCCAMQVIAIREDAMARLATLVQEIPSSRLPSTAERTLLAVHCCNLALAVSPAADAGVLARRALGEGALLREQTSESLAVSLAIIALVLCGHATEAQGFADRVLADARERGAVLAFAEASMVRALATLARGRIGDAMADAQAAIDGVQRGWRALVPIPHAILAYCLVQRGELDPAEGVLEEVIPLLPDEDAMGINAWYYWARGHLRAARGEPGDALREYLTAGRILDSYGYRNPTAVPWRTDAAAAASASGDQGEAQRLIDELAREFGLPAALGRALRARAISGAHDVPGLEAAIAVLEEADAPLELARALFDLGSAHRRAGRRIVSREPLRRALELAHVCGATVLEQGIRDELLATGARPRRTMTSGLASLTPSERRIAELVADGHSNRAVAETLFLTKGTVEWHLRHIYQKLDLSRREQLSERVAAEHVGSPAA